MRLTNKIPLTSYVVRNKRYYYICFLCLLLSQISKGQGSMNSIKFDRNTLTFEVFGHSRSIFSLNYERLFKLSPYSSYTFRTGIGYVPGDSIRLVRHKGTVTIPLVLTTLVGKKKNYLQLSAGYSASFGESYIDSTYTLPQIHQKFESAFIVSLGYRRMSEDLVIQIFPLLQWTNNPTSKFGFGFGFSIGFPF